MSKRGHGAAFDEHDEMLDEYAPGATSTPWAPLDVDVLAEIEGLRDDDSPTPTQQPAATVIAAPAPLVWGRPEPDAHIEDEMNDFHAVAPTNFASYHAAAEVSTIPSDIAVPFGRPPASWPASSCWSASTSAMAASTRDGGTASSRFVPRAVQFNQHAAQGSQHRAAAAHASARSSGRGQQHQGHVGDVSQMFF